MPKYYGEIFKSKITRRFHWRLRSSDNGQIVASSTGGVSRGYSEKAEAARMYSRIFEEKYPLRAEV